jgi:flavin reductase (DIM6/NTAB) family NADH-FMN oxidoreductase RutF
MHLVFFIGDCIKHRFTAGSVVVVSITKTGVVISSATVKYAVNATIRTGSHVLVCLDTYMDSIKGLHKEKTTPNDDLIAEILSGLCSVVSIISLIGMLYQDIPIHDFQYVLWRLRRI